MLNPLLGAYAAKLAHALPSQCAVCHAWSRQRVCAACVERFAPKTQRCTSCAIRLTGSATRCGACLLHGSVLDACYAAVDYDYPWDSLLAKLKFDGGSSVGGVSGADPAIARALADIMRAQPEVVQALAQTQWVMPVPLASARLRERGFNQAAQLAKQLLTSTAKQAPTLAALRSDVLVRTRDTPAQVGLGRAERQRNMLHAFAVDPAHAGLVRGARVALVDDVTTTTSTLCAAAAALRSAGAVHVVAVVFARTPVSALQAERLGV
jgi:ComF family protein